MIETLVSRNILAQRSFDRPGTFEYHPLVRGLLRDELAADDPGKVHALHCSAAQWYAESDEPIVAIRHYSLARDWVAVMRILGSVALPLAFSSQSTALASALSMADAEAAQRPTVETLLAAAVCSYQRRDLESMSRHTDAATRLLAGVYGDPDPATLLVIAVVSMLHARFFSPGSISSSATSLQELLLRRCGAGPTSRIDQTVHHPRRRDSEPIAP